MKWELYRIAFLDKFSPSFTCAYNYYLYKTFFLKKKISKIEYKNAWV